MKILEAAALELPCNACGGYFELPLVQLLESAEIVHGSCCEARTADDCPPVAYSAMLPGEAIQALSEAWTELEGRASAIGGRLVVHPVTAR